MSDKTETSTPRTDAILQVDCVGDDFSPLIEHARTLERELAAANAALVAATPYLTEFSGAGNTHATQLLRKHKVAIDSAKAGGEHGKAHHD